MVRLTQRFVDGRKASWSLSQELAEQQGTLRRHVNDSQKKISDLSQEIGSQTLFLQENASWMQRLTNLVNGSVSIISAVHNGET